MSFTTALCIKPFSSSHSRRCRHRHRHRQQDDPTSPKVDCMGQIHRYKAAKKAAEKAAEKSAVPPLPLPLQHGSRRFYLLMATVSFFASPLKQVMCAKKTKPALMGRRVVSVEDIEPPLPVAVKEMDPPLPVREIENPALSLWKRRCRSRKLEELFFCSQEKLQTPIAVIVV